MRTNLDYLPPGKQRELAFIVDVLTQHLAAKVATRNPAHLGQGKILKIILFGSYARGDWVEDPVGRYFSDYDILVVVSHDRLADAWEFWGGAEQVLLEALSEGGCLRTPVNFIVHSLDDVNQRLRRGQYFFADIVREGVLLFDVPGFPLAVPTFPSATVALLEASAHFEKWLPSSEAFRESAIFLMRRGNPNEAAFNLHQAVEALYNCLLLVLTLYTPKSHNLVRLRNLVEALDERLKQVWPADSKFQRRAFELLRAAYVKARYSPHYRINHEELTWLLERVELLQELAREICEARLQQLANGASG